MVNWERVDGNDRPGKMSRVWAARGGWPRVSASLYPGYLGEPGLRIAVNRRDSEGAWWEAANLPVELVPELIEMLREAMGTSGEGNHG